ncbi:hypothetical protein SARC_14293, partial [Sphaeroforma arctica JP610]
MDFCVVENTNDFLLWKDAESEELYDSDTNTYYAKCETDTKTGLQVVSGIGGLMTDLTAAGGTITIGCGTDFCSASTET